MICFVHISCMRFTTTLRSNLYIGHFTKTIILLYSHPRNNPPAISGAISRVIRFQELSQLFSKAVLSVPQPPDIFQKNNRESQFLAIAIRLGIFTENGKPISCFKFMKSQNEEFRGAIIGNKTKCGNS